jgi:hypothetical protein
VQKQMKARVFPSSFSQVMPRRATYASCVLGFAIAALVAHLATSWRYGYFRDELYFIACSKHLAWGYVDQPPLVAFAAWLSAPFHYNLVALRLLPAIAAALTVWLSIRIVRELGGGVFAQCVAALATLLLPAYLLLGNTLTTTSFEPLSWTLLIFCAIRLARTRDPRWWIACGLAFAFGMYGKYSMLLLVCALLIGLLCTAQRRLLLSPWFAYGVVLAGALLAPNLVWQGAHAWPFVQVVQGDFAHRHAFQTGVSLEYKNIAQNAVAFLIEQVIYTNPVTVPLWLGGVAVLGFSPRYRDCRFVAIASPILLILAIWLEAKGYYIIGVYAALISAGSVLFERAVAHAAWRAAAVAIYVAVSLAVLPLSLPVLSVGDFIAYSKALHLTGQNGAPARLIQPLYAEEFGWNELAARVAQVYRGLPPAVRARAGIFADTYGDAGGLDFYGPRYGLPPAISAQNTYYLWGTRGYDGSTLIVVGATQAGVVRSLYRKMTLVATYGSAYKWVVEGPTPIYLCRDPIAPLSQIWPRLRWYGA